MRSYSSKPSSDAGLRPIRDFIPGVLEIISRAYTGREMVLDGAACAQALPARANRSLSLPERQPDVALQPATLTGRHRAPTWGPTQWGGEGTTSGEVQACTAVLARRA
jgi:hypothetical protein